MSGQGIMKMRFWLLLAVLVGLSTIGVAQQNNTYRVKRSTPDKAARRSAPVGKTAGPTMGSTSTAKDLQNIERQTAKTSAPARTAGKKAAGTGAALKPAKDKPNPPINFNGGGGKKAGTTSQPANPLKGRLKEKHSHQ